MGRSEVLLGPDNNIEFLKHFYEYLTEKLKYKDVTCFILKFLPWWICYYIVATFSHL